MFNTLSEDSNAYAAYNEKDINSPLNTNQSDWFSP